MEQSFWILCRSPAALSIPSCKYKASWLMATSAEFNILPAYTPSHFLCLLCRELWVLGKHSINKCIVRVTLRSGYSNNSSYFQKEKWLLFVSRGQQTTLLVSFQLFLCPPAIFIPPLLWLFFYIWTPLPAGGVLKCAWWEQFDPLHSPQHNANTLDLRGAGGFEQYDNCSS